MSVENWTRFKLYDGFGSGYRYVHAIRSDDPAPKSIPPSTDITERIFRTVDCWPIELCALVSGYLTFADHVWHNPPSWRKLRFDGVETIEVDDRPGGLSSAKVPWYRCASSWTIGTGIKRWTVGFTPIFTGGWIICGIIDDIDPRPVTIKESENEDGLYFDSSAFWITKSCNGFVARRGSKDGIRISADDSKAVIRSIDFLADDVSYQVVVVVGQTRFLLADLAAQPDLFYRMRPAVLVSGCLSATLLCRT